MIVGSMRNWIDGHDFDTLPTTSTASRDKTLVSKVLDSWKDKTGHRVAVVHCKAGKGRSGTVACSYLIAECGWTPEQALARFTERRMRPNMGAGVSIPSQLRTIGYVDRWARAGKKYVDREVEILEIHVWGLRNGVKVEVEGYVEQGKRIKVFHTFDKSERLVVQGDPPGGNGVMDMVYDMAGYTTNPTEDTTDPSTQQEVLDDAKSADAPAGVESPRADPAESAGSPTSTKSKISKRTSTIKSRLSRNSSTRSTRSARDKPKDGPGPSKLKSPSSSSSSLNKLNTDPEPGGRAVVFKPAHPVRVPNSDVNISLERRNRAPGTVGLTMVTAVAHVWFNVFFEGNGPEQGGKPATDGVFEIDWEKMDGIKGSGQKGTKAADKIAVVWRSIVPEGEGDEVKGEVVSEPAQDEPVPGLAAADWKGGNEEDPGTQKSLGLRAKSPDSANVSQASSIKGEIIADAHKKGERVKDIVAQSTTDGTNAKGESIRDTDQKLETYAEKLPAPSGSEKD
jgi:protein-tyrosine phosphatase